MSNRDYAPPALREYGSVAELTGIGGGSANTDVFINLTGFTVTIGGTTIGAGETVTGTGSIEGCLQPVGRGPCRIPH